MKSDLELKDLLKESNAKILTENWSKLKHTLQLPLKKSDIIKALLAIIFGQEILDKILNSSSQNIIVDSDLFTKKGNYMIECSFNINQNLISAKDYFTY